MSSNTYGRQVVLPLTNKSGGSVAAGDVVIVDTGNNDAFTTTTSAGFTGLVGIATGTIASNAVGVILIEGYASLVNTSASVTRGNFGKTHTVAKQAVDAGSTRGVGTFCQFLTGGTTPDAVIYPVDLLGSSLTNPMTTKGDIIQADTGGTPVRLAAATAGFILTAGGAGAFSAWAAPAAGALTKVSGTLSGDVALTAVTLTDGPTVTLTSGTWLVNYAWTIKGTNASKLEIYTVLQSNESGTPLFDEGDVTTAIINGGYATGGARSAICVLTEATPIVKFRIRVDQSSTTMIRDTLAVAGTTHTATRIDAIKIA